jgi:hypothetical protein
VPYGRETARTAHCNFPPPPLHYLQYTRHQCDSPSSAAQRERNAASIVMHGRPYINWDLPQGLHSVLAAARKLQLREKRVYPRSSSQCACGSHVSNSVGPLPARLRSSLPSRFSQRCLTRPPIWIPHRQGLRLQDLPGGRHTNLPVLGQVRHITDIAPQLRSHGLSVGFERAEGARIVTLRTESKLPLPHDPTLQSTVPVLTHALIIPPSFSKY